MNSTINKGNIEKLLLIQRDVTNSTRNDILILQKNIHNQFEKIQPYKLEWCVDNYKDDGNTHTKEDWDGVKQEENDTTNKLYNVLKQIC